jgi:hypothetical protein
MRKATFNQLLKYVGKKDNRAGFNCIFRNDHILYVTDSFSIFEITCYELFKPHEPLSNEWKIINSSCLPALDGLTYAHLEIACNHTNATIAQETVLKMIGESGREYFGRFFDMKFDFPCKYDAKRVKGIMAIFDSLGAPIHFAYDGETNSTVFWGSGKNYDIRAMLMPLR